MYIESMALSITFYEAILYTKLMLFGSICRPNNPDPTSKPGSYTQPKMLAAGRQCEELESRHTLSSIKEPVNI